MEVVLATSNPHKAAQARQIAAGTGLDLIEVPMWLGYEETGTTLHENARLKAAAASRLTGRPVLAEDAGLEVDALGGLPGPRSARFAGASATDEDNNAKLLRLLRDFAPEPWTARYRAVAVLLLPSTAELTAEGVLEGRIVAEARGNGGFGYDPIFVPAGYDKTSAELSDSERVAINHRGQALRSLIEQLRSSGLLERQVTAGRKLST